jgi:hypothetical protein
MARRQVLFKLPDIAYVRLEPVKNKLSCSAGYLYSRVMEWTYIYTLIGMCMHVQISILDYGIISVTRIGLLMHFIQQFDS